MKAASAIRMFGLAAAVQVSGCATMKGLLRSAGPAAIDIKCSGESPLKTSTTAPVKLAFNDKGVVLENDQRAYAFCAFTSPARTGIDVSCDYTYERGGPLKPSRTNEDGAGVMTVNGIQKLEFTDSAGADHTPVMPPGTSCTLTP